MFSNGFLVARHREPNVAMVLCGVIFMIERKVRVSALLADRWTNEQSLAG